MTENEAIKILKRDLSIQIENKALPDGIEAIKTAIQALEEIQQYRSIGTVEEISKLIKFLSCDDDTSILEYLRMLIEYRAIGTVEEFKDLKEYQIKMRMRYLEIDDINNLLEPFELSLALEREIRKYEYRKEHKPQDISPLDYTIIYALKHCLEEQMAET